MTKPANKRSQKRAKELLTTGELECELAKPSSLGSRLDDRTWRRPAGSSARLFKRVGENDPFIPQKSSTPSKHRPVYVGDRFVRIDQATQQRQETKAPAPQPRTRPKPQQPATPKQPFQPKQPAKRKLPAVSAKAQSAPGPQESSEQRPPLPKPEPIQSKVSKSGRFRPQRRTSSSKLVQGGEPPGGRLQTVEAPPEPAAAPFSSPSASPQKRTQVTSPAMTIPDPSPLAREPTEPLQPKKPEKPKQRPMPKKPLKPGASSLDDLFAAPQEGRLRIPRRAKKTES